MANKKNTENIKKPITVSKIKEDKRTPKKIKKEKKIKMIIVLLIIIILIIFVLIKIAPIKKQVNDNLIYNNNKSFIKQQKIDEIVFENIKCSYDGKDSLITYKISNNTNKKLTLSNYDIIVKDKNKVVITKIVASVGQELAPKKSIDMANSVVGVDLTNAYYMELEMKKN
ncbi:MAG: hypothetical protein IKE75_04935 [Bacilli bacterium]|nr:hypothetical protein [Bacilli bacterium]